MANNQSKIENNVPGKFYVDESCIGCCQCRDIISDVFKEDADSGCCYVVKQPTPSEESLTIEAMNSCPVDAIGDDG